MMQKYHRFPLSLYLAMFLKPMNQHISLSCPNTSIVMYITFILSVCILLCFNVYTTSASQFPLVDFAYSLFKFLTLPAVCTSPDVSVSLFLCFCTRRLLLICLYLAHRPIIRDDQSSPVVIAFQ
jgi:hypothetical protein